MTCAWLALLLPALLLPTLLGAQEVRITYLANEGVLLDGGGTRILVDALFRDSLDAYARHEPAVQEQMETGQKPFDGIALALATHFHLDHWDAGAITRFLRHNPQAQFASTEQGTAMLPWSQRDRYRNLWPATGMTSSLATGAAKVTAIPLQHGTTQNLAYRIEIAGKVIAHLGDAEPEPESFQKLAAAGAVDVALVPFWWLLDAQATAFMKTEWKARNVVALHVGGTDTGYTARLQAAWSGVWVPTKALESRSF